MELKQRTPKEMLAYFDGYAAATRDYAIWNDGEQTIGVRREPLKTALERIEMHRETARAMRLNDGTFDFGYDLKQAAIAFARETVERLK